MMPSLSLKSDGPLSFFDGRTNRRLAKGVVYPISENEARYFKTLSEVDVVDDPPKAKPKLAPEPPPTLIISAPPLSVPAVAVESVTSTDVVKPPPLPVGPPPKRKPGRPPKNKKE